MTKKQLKLTILSNFAVLALTFVMLVSVSLAWFFSGANLLVNQSVQVGVFKVDVSDNVASGETSLIALDSAYPMSAEKAIALAASNEKNVYTFSAENVGNVPAQLLVSAKVKADTNYVQNPDPLSKLKPLATQVRYATKIYASTATEPEWLVGEKLFNQEGSVNVSLKQHFVNTMLTPSGDNFVSKPEYIIHSNLNTTGQTFKLIFKLLVWIDSDATLESIGALTVGGTNPSLQFYLNVKALQFGGGANFSATEVAYKPADQIPDTIV